LEHGQDLPRVLVVDDQVDYIELVSAMLERLGLEVKVASSAPDALAIAEVFSPDIALIDLAMPHVSGLELARQLRDLPGQSNLLLIAVTAYGDVGTRKQADEAGFLMYLVKPVKLEVFHDVLVLATARARRRVEP
jgi:CheY-like chemotaxis protein